MMRAVIECKVDPPPSELEARRLRLYLGIDSVLGGVPVLLLGERIDLLSPALEAFLTAGPESQERAAAALQHLLLWYCLMSSSRRAADKEIKRFSRAKGVSRPRRLIGGRDYPHA